MVEYQRDQSVARLLSHNSGTLLLGAVLRPQIGCMQDGRHPAIVGAAKKHRGNSMKRIASLTASALAAISLSLTPGTASADTDDLAKIIAGIAVVGIIAKAIDNRNDRKNNVYRDDAIGAGRLGRIDDGVRYDRYGRPIYDGRRDRDNHKGPKDRRGYKKQALPRQCLSVIETPRGDRQVYSAQCLNRNYRFADKLPESCETVVRTSRGYRTVYGVRCLARDGWRVAGR
jgi:hypothetical protein